VKGERVRDERGRRGKEKWRKNKIHTVEVVTLQAPASPSPK
jgi:hypothetical protein